MCWVHTCLAWVRLRASVEVVILDETLAKLESPFPGGSHSKCDPLEANAGLSSQRDPAKGK